MALADTLAAAALPVCYRLLAGLRVSSVDIQALADALHAYNVSVANTAGDGDVVYEGQFVNVSNARKFNRKST